MDQVLSLYKPIGVTPLQLIKKFQEKYSDYQNIKLSYAGRLDPMAEGLLLVLAGEENKKRHMYQDLTKEYACTVLFGIETDTYDILGKIIHSQTVADQQAIFTATKKLIPAYIGKQKQSYPPYSSQPVNGKPLYYWARQNKLSEVSIPTKHIEIYDIQLLTQTEIAAKDLQDMVLKKLEHVSGDFRQEEIKYMWKVFFEKNIQASFPSLSLHVSCSSGTYIRSLAHKIGKELGTGGIALGIKRTKIGNYTLNNALYLQYNNLDAKR